MELIGYISAHVVGWLLVLVRVAGIFIAAPVFAHQQVPVQVRVMASLAFTLALAPLAAPHTLPLPSAVLPFAAAVVREAMLGLALGFLPALVFLAVQYAAELIDLQVGMGMGGWIDPTFRVTISPLSSFQYLLATVFFLALDGHHIVIEGLARSFRVIPLGSFALTGAAGQGMTHLFAQMALFGIQIAAPILSVLLIADLGMGILGRVAPQLNLLIMSPSLKAMLALVALVTALPVMLMLAESLFTEIRGELFSFLQAAVSGAGGPYGG